MLFLYENCRDIAFQDGCPNPLVKIVDHFSNIGCCVCRHFKDNKDIYIEIVKEFIAAKTRSALTCAELKDVEVENFHDQSLRIGLSNKHK